MFTLLRQSPDYRSEEDDRQVAITCPQLGSTNRLEHARVRPGTHSFPAKSAIHWLYVIDRVRFRVCVQVFRCLHKMAPEYLSTYTANPSPA